MKMLCNLLCAVQLPCSLYFSVLSGAFMVTVWTCVVSAGAGFVPLLIGSASQLLGKDPAPTVRACVPGGLACWRLSRDGRVTVASRLA